MASSASRSASTKKTSKRDAPSSKKKAKLEVESDVDDDSTSASSYDDGGDEEAAVEDEEEESADGSDDEGDQEDSAGSSDGQKKRKKSTPSSKKPKKSKDDSNVRVVKKIKKIDGPRSDPNTSVILPTTMQFLADLIKHNDRDWFSENDARYRHALANWTAFVQAWVPLATEADWSLPHLPAKELMERIYRDVRFSKDKTPYKTHLGATHSRTGRKGPFANYYMHIGATSSLICGGIWQPSSDDTKKIRAMILDDPRPLREVLANKDFVKWFGEPDPKAGKRTSVFGHDDQLKNCPKMEGVTKDHPDIDLLKLRSVAVAHYFKTEEVLAPDFLEKKVIPAMKVLAPFVQLLNEILVPTPPSDDEE